EKVAQGHGRAEQRAGQRVLARALGKVAVEVDAKHDRAGQFRLDRRHVHGGDDQSDDAEKHDETERTDRREKADQKATHGDTVSRSRDAGFYINSMPAASASAAAAVAPAAVAAAIAAPARIEAAVETVK